MKIFRLVKIYYIKIIRSNGTSHGIAMSIALGLFVGCFLPIGTQTLPVIFFAIILRLDKLLAFIASWICNPYTVPLMYPLFCYTGSKVLGLGLTLSQIEKDVLKITHSFSWNALKDLGLELGVSFFIGGFIYGGVIALIGYFITFYFIARYRKRKKRLHTARL